MKYNRQGVKEEDGYEFFVMIVLISISTYKR